MPNRSADEQRTNERVGKEQRCGRMKNVDKSGQKLSGKNRDESGQKTQRMSSKMVEDEI